MYGHKYGQVYFNSLPVPGGEGTLRNRLKDLRGNLVAKTGSLSYVYTLSGYMKTAGGEPIAFSIMLNAYNSKDGRSGRDELDVIPRVLAKIGAIPE
jgi:D-alanyl-D-alanine carboxypeptidase/D-alanyl-D-alanine-endopeptidase (penicillin-binding protein 4)